MKTHNTKLAGWGIRDPRYLIALVAVLVAVLVPGTMALGAGVVVYGMGMILDAQTLLSDAQAITVDAVSTNTYDSGAAGNDISVGEPLCMAFTVDVAADGTTTDETYEFQVIQSAAAALTSPDVLCLRAIGYATLVAGFKFYLPIPPGSKTKRYLGVNYNVGGTTPTITVTAAILPLSMIQNEKTYADALTISS